MVSFSIMSVPLAGGMKVLVTTHVSACPGSRNTDAELPAKVWPLSHAISTVNPSGLSSVIVTDPAGTTSHSEISWSPSSNEPTPAMRSWFDCTRKSQTSPMLAPTAFFCTRIALAVLVSVQETLVLATVKVTSFPGVESPSQTKPTS